MMFFQSTSSISQQAIVRRKKIYNKKKKKSKLVIYFIIRNKTDYDKHQIHTHAHTKSNNMENIIETEETRDAEEK